ncbi:hypothetical protein [Aeromonas veronii]|uniref:hypothetical protein n=1 Tax=Aeromonas veronii TaxID=654 RepID=UPI003D1A8BEC
MQIFNVGYCLIISCMLFFLSVVLMTPYISGVLLVNATTIYSFILLLTFFAMIFKRGLSIKAVTLAAMFIATILVLVLLTQSQVHFNRYIFQAIGLLLCFIVAKEYKIINRLTDLLTIFAILGILCAFIGFFYALFGGQPAYSFPNPDSRLNFVYLTTFSNAVYGNVIRPAFIYDEPGAFSFVLCFIVILRELMQRRASVSLGIMIGGLITFSLAHIVILVLFIFSKIKFSLKSLIGIMLASILLLSIFNLVSNSNEFNFFTARFEINDSGSLSGDNRIGQIDNFKKIFSWDIFWGGDYQCHHLQAKRCLEHGDISSSVVTPLYFGGVIQLIVQLITHIFFILAVYRNKTLFFPAFAMSLLLLQRPYFSLIGYQIMIYIVLFIMFYLIKYKHVHVSSKYSFIH